MRAFLGTGCVLTTLFLLSAAQPSLAHGNSFTYQGQLKANGQVLNGQAFIIARVYDAAAGGTLLGQQGVGNVTVSAGLFTALLNTGNEFGPEMFNGSPRWLELEINGETLSPRQRITPAPLAHSASVAQNAERLDGPIYQDNAEGYFTRNSAGAFEEFLYPRWLDDTTYMTVGDNGMIVRSPDYSTHIQIDVDGNMSIGGGAPRQQLDVRGQLQVVDSIRMDAADEPMIVRQFDPFTSGPLAGFGRWGMFMQPAQLFLGAAGSDYLGSSRITLGGWNANGTREDWVDVRNTGNVGIGTTNPLTRLHVSSPSHLTGIVESNNTIGTWLNLRNTSPGGQSWKLISSGSANGEGSGKLIFGASDAIGDVTSIPMVITPTGVGIGTASPQALLHVAGTMRTGVIQITGGSDIAEPFNVREGTGNGEQSVDKIEPGMVVSIDPNRVGEMRLSGQAYDTTVAGIISGANGVNTGLTLTQEGSIADGKHPVAMTGRVWCFVDADAGGPVKAGDLLTTSNTPGHAMKVGDHARSQGAVLGKAMSSLDSGRGLVLVLVGLQ